MVFAEPGTLYQLLIALQFSILLMAVTAQASPFRTEAGKYCSLVAAVATILVLLMCIILQTTTLVDNLKSSNVQNSIYAFLHVDFLLTLVMLVLSTLAVAAVTSFFLYLSIKNMTKWPRAKHLRSRAPCQLIHGKAKKYHVFISHKWTTYAAGPRLPPAL